MNLGSLQALGGMSSEVQESLNNFQGDRGLQSGGLFSLEVQFGEREELLGVHQGGFRQQHLHAVIWAGFPSGAAFSGGLWDLPDSGRAGHASVCSLVFCFM
jgi:hypothetical protein